MAKIIDLELFEAALTQAAWKFSQLSVAEQQKRPLRPPEHCDMTHGVQALQDFRKEWAARIALRETTGEKTDFASFRSELFDSLRLYYNWSIETRNLYSSAVALYINWDKKASNELPKNWAEIKEQVNYAKFIQNF